MEKIDNNPFILMEEYLYKSKVCVDQFVLSIYLNKMNDENKEDLDSLFLSKSFEMEGLVEFYSQELDVIRQSVYDELKEHVKSGVEISNIYRRGILQYPETYIRLEKQVKHELSEILDMTKLIEGLIDLIEHFSDQKNKYEEALNFWYLMRNELRFTWYQTKSTLLRILPANTMKKEEKFPDYSNSNKNEKVTALYELGIIDFIRENHHINTSINNLASIVGYITGIDTSTVQSYMNPIYSTNVDQKNNPLKNQKLVSKVRERLSELNVGSSWN